MKTPNPDDNELPNFLTPQEQEEIQKLLEAELGVGPGRSTAAKDFEWRYFNNPALFVEECFAWKSKAEGPTAYQLDILNHLKTQKRVSVRGPHGLGKTALSSWIVLWFALTREAAGVDWKIPTTASAWRHLQRFLWPEIKKWAKRLDWNKVAFRGPFNENTELLSLSLQLCSGNGFALASNDSAAIEGAHATELLYLFDEAKTIMESTWDSAEGAFSTGNCRWICVSTPGEPNGRFFDIQRRKAGFEDWWVRHVTLKETIASGRVSQDWADARARQWGENSPVYINRVLGEFSTDNDQGVIPLTWIERANDRWQEWVEAGRPGWLTRLGVDVGFTEDKTVFARVLSENVVESIEFLPKPHPDFASMEIAGKVKGILDGNAVCKAVIDANGIGSGVYHRLKEQKLCAEAFIAQEKSEAKDISGELGFTNKRSAAWWQMKEMLDPQGPHNVALPPDDTLTGDLTAPKWTVQSGGRIQVESKIDIKKRLGRSTDAADAVIMAFFQDVPEVPKYPMITPAQMMRGIRRLR